MNDMNQQTLRRVSHSENEAVGGQALSCKAIFEGDMKKIAAIRDRQEAYLASLPTKPAECLLAAMRLLHPNGEEFPEGIEEALYLSVALEPMLAQLEGDQPGIEREALLYVARRITKGLMSAVPKLQDVSDILRNPSRIERDERNSRL